MFDLRALFGMERFFKRHMGRGMLPSGGLERISMQFCRPYCFIYRHNDAHIFYGRSHCDEYYGVSLVKSLFASIEYWLAMMNNTFTKMT